MRIKIDKYFLEEKCPYSGKRKINVKTLKVIGGSALIIGIIFILFAGSQDKTQGQAQVNAKVIDEVKSHNLQSPETSGAISSLHDSDGYFSSHQPQSSSRSYGASQLVHPSEGSGDQLPQGTTISLKLLNTVVSSDSNSPVIAVVENDIYWRNAIKIPANTKAIGQASFDDTAKRLQVRFHTFVFPEGDEHPVAGIGLLDDGSSGLTGDYHSGAFSKQAGRFIGTFVGGFAEGMKERETAGQMGLPYEPGNLKNGVLNGITESSLDQAKLYAEDMSKAKPYLEVEAGGTFLLYLEKGF